MLTALAFRGMSRSCWEQDRPHAATLLAPASHAILALLSFYLILESWTWQSVIVSIAVGTLTGAVEITWHVLRFHQSTPRWLLPLYRLSISIPAVAIGSLSLIRELPSSYTIVLAHLLVTTRFTWNKGKSNTIPEGRFTTLALIYLLFVGLVIIALVYS
jgi:hypothetical protein